MRTRFKVIFECLQSIGMHVGSTNCRTVAN
uniref:Uncharacterized protein n=1 Tax=Schistosoma japonicum TaxID=6182 RepID=Q5BWB1_SCHJA|nr:unknown [Schistosoma japonicum]